MQQSQAQMWPGWYNQQPWACYPYYHGVPPSVPWLPTYPVVNPPGFNDSDNPGNSSHRNRRESDQEWVNEWVRKLGKCSLKLKQKSRPCLSIPEVKSRLKEALLLLNDLSAVHKQLKEVSHDSDKSYWDIKCQKATEIRTKFEGIRSVLILNNEQIEKKLNRIKKKRIRNKRRKAELKQEAEFAALTRENLNRDLDEWQNQIYERVKRTKREEELKAEADSILSEVRKKISETKRAYELVTSLQKLRMLKKQSAESRGLYTTKESDEKFATTTKSMEEMLKIQLNDYQDEEKALCVMLDKEAEKKEANDLQIKLENIQSNLIQSLFGNSQITPDDPRHPFSLYYTQADGNFDSLLCIRQEWDSYCNNNDGSSVPFPWVVPENPSNETWATVLSS